MKATRREFASGLASLMGGVLLPHSGVSSTAPLIRIGVLSDPHVDYRISNDDELIKQLKWLDGLKVDAVVFPGDIANRGRIDELERFVAAWDSVFPKCKAVDGRSVERLVVTGNHDIDQWPALWKGMSEEELSKLRFNHADNKEKVWKRIFGEEWSLIWKKEVKGISFVGAQWISLKPQVARFFDEHAGDFDAGKPFFYIQHPHPKGTCHGEFAKEGCAEDSGIVTRVLSQYPNAIALSGHSHITLTDPRTVWQGAFTSIGCGSCGRMQPTGFGSAKCHANGGPTWEKKLNRTFTNDQEGRCGMMIEVYPDRLLIHRRSFFFDEPIGRDWSIPFPACARGRSAFPVCGNDHDAPQFPPGARIEVSRMAEGLVLLKYPPAEGVGSSRVFDYEVVAKIGVGSTIRRDMLAAGFHLPDSRRNRPETCLFAHEEIPTSRQVEFRVTPRSAHGNVGRAISTCISC